LREAFDALDTSGSGELCLADVSKITLLMPFVINLQWMVPKVIKMED
jgi:hypothetical protein